MVTTNLLSNSGYRKTVTNEDGHQELKYCTEVGASTSINDRRFRKFDVVVDNTYDINTSERIVKYALPIHVRLFAYQYAKLLVLWFHRQVTRTTSVPLLRHGYRFHSMFIYAKREVLDGSGRVQSSRYTRDVSFPLLSSSPVQRGAVRLLSLFAFYAIRPR